MKHAVQCDHLPFDCFVTQVSICQLSPPSVLPCHCQAAAMFPLLNLIREQAVDVLIYETSGRQALMHYVAFVMSLGSLSFFPSARHMPGVPEMLTKMRLIRHVYEHCHQVIVPLCGAFELQMTPQLLSGHVPANAETVVRASSQLIAQAADLMHGKDAFVEMLVSANPLDREAEIQRLAHIKWFGGSVTASLGKCRANVRFLKEVVGHLSLWAKEVLTGVQAAMAPNPDVRNVRPRLAEPDAEPTAVADRVPLAPAHPIAVRVPGGIIAHAGSGIPAPPGHGEEVQDEDFQDDAVDELEQDVE